MSSHSADCQSAYGFRACTVTEGQPLSLFIFGACGGGGGGGGVVYPCKSITKTPLPLARTSEWLAL